MKRLACCLSILGAVGLFATGGRAQTPGDPIPGHYIVTFQANAGPPDSVAQELGRANGVRVLHVYRFAMRGMGIEIRGAHPERVVNALRLNPLVRTVGPDRYLAADAQAIPKGIDRINAEPALAANTGSGIRVAIVDTGLDFAQADLAANIDVASSANCINAALAGCTPGAGQDDNGHGTFVGGIVAALNNTRDVVGVGPQITLLTTKVLDSSGSGSFLDIIAAMDYLIQLGNVSVANMSLGARCSVCTDNSSDPVIAAFHDSVRAVVNAGTTVVVSAGNDGTDASTSVPASFDEVITVSALTDLDGQPGGAGGAIIIPGLGKMNDDSLAKFSNFGVDIDVTGPGVNETSLRLGGGTTSGSGTSFSSPHAAGVAALFIRDQLNKAQPAPAPGTVRQALIQTGECAEGNGSVFAGAAGCSQIWPGDRDGIPEPLVRADNIKNFSAASVRDVAVTSISAPSPVSVNTAQSVDVGVANQGTQSETFTVSLSDSLAATISAAQGVTLAAGNSQTVTFNWTPTATGDHTLTATASSVPSETDLADNTRSAVSTVTQPGSAPTVTGIDPAGMQAGATVNVTISGTNFANGAGVTFENGSGPSPSASNVVVVNANTITATLSVKSGGPPGTRVWDVVVTNPDGLSGRLSGGFTVTR